MTRMVAAVLAAIALHGCGTASRSWVDCGESCLEWIAPGAEPDIGVHHQQRRTFRGAAW